MILYLLAASGMAGFFLWQDRGSLERANGLFRAGDVQGAEQLYRTRVATPSPAPAALYNLGTTLLTPGTVNSEEYLRLATQAGDPTVSQRSHYNLGVGYLAQFAESGEPDSWIPLLEAAIGSSREALRLDPRDQNARWNLALAQETLDALTEVIEGPDDEMGAGQEAEDEGGIVIPQTAQVGLPPPIRGGREALAGEDPGPLSESEARELLNTFHGSPERLIWGIFWANRPDVQWWAESYPGGNW